LFLEGSWHATCTQDPADETCRIKAYQPIPQ